MPNENNQMSLIVTKEVDKKDLNYYIGNSITITITLTNYSENALENLLVVDEIPDEIIPDSSEGFLIEITKGQILQNSNEIKILIERLEVNETLTITIFGRIGKI